MATYNGERFIREQLESIARQTLSPFELIVTDDNSSDRTVEIIRDFARSAPFPVRVHRNEKRLWYRENFFSAASRCTGDLIAFSDQDDVWLDEKLAKCANALRDESVMLAVHSAKMVDENLEPMGWLVPRISHDAVTSPLTIGPGRDFSGFAMVFRRSLPLYFTTPRPWNSVEHNGTMHHDQWAFFLARVFGRTAYIRGPLALHRRHRDTSTKPVRSVLAQAVRRASTAGAKSYLNRAELNEEWASFLERAVPSLEKTQRVRAEDAVRHYRHIATTFRMRSEIYQNGSPFSVRLLSLIRLFVRGGYGSRSRQGLGARSFLKDAGSGLLKLHRHRCR